MNLDMLYTKTEYGNIWNPHVEHLQALRDFDNFNQRSAFTHRFAWSIPDVQYGLAIRKLNVPIIEIGAGTGYWAWWLKQFGIDIIAYDTEPYKNHYVDAQWTDVLKGSYRHMAKHRERSLMMCWPPYDEPLAYNALQFYTGEYLVYVGEGEDGCTADHNFYDLLSREWEEVYRKYAVNWSGIHSHNCIYRRKT